MAVSCYNCEYLLNILEEHFVLNGGNLAWITGGLKAVDASVLKFAEVNEILAYKPWNLNARHIELLLEKDENGSSWSFQQVLMGASVLSHYHSLACFVLGQGLTEDSQRVFEQLLIKSAHSGESGYDSDFQNNSDADTQTFWYLKNHKKSEESSYEGDQDEEEQDGFDETFQVETAVTLEKVEKPKGSNDQT